MKKLSIIIPVYQVEKYIDKCIRSCVDQDIPRSQYEIIVINDGSRDKSLTIIESLAEGISNIIIISQKNAGLSAARNCGLQQAIGEYVWFIDSDDWISNNILDSVLEICDKNKLDMLAIDRYKVYSNNLVLFESKTRYLNKVINGRECLEENKYQIPAQLYIYRKSFLLENRLKFKHGILHEDKDFTPRAIYYSQRILYLKKAIYYHLQREGSITNTINPKRCYDLLGIVDSLNKFAKLHVKQKGSEKMIIREAFFAFTYAALLLRKVNDSGEVELISKAMKNRRQVLVEMLKDPSYVYKCQAILCLISPRLFSKFYLILKLIIN